MILSIDTEKVQLTLDQCGLRYTDHPHNGKSTYNLDTSHTQIPKCRSKIVFDKIGTYSVTKNQQTRI